MKTVLAALILTSVLFTTVSFAQKNDEQALLAIHARDREAHLRGDANLLTADTASEIVDVGRGHFDRTTRDQVREHFIGFFKQATYSSYEDMAPPVVHIAPDGKSGWMAVQIKAHITMKQEGKPPEEMDFQSAWLATYEKQNGKWLMTAIAYSVPAGK